MNPQFKEIGETLVKQIYLCFDEGNKEELAVIYDNNSLLTYESEQRQGRDSIMEKVRLLPRSKHAVTRIDCQPLPGGNIMAVALGLLKTEGEDNPLGFNHTFIMKPCNNSYIIQNEVFQLALHNM